MKERTSLLTTTDEANAFFLRTLLIHDFRKLLLRDPELPEVLLPPKWLGQSARSLTKELYRRLLISSERHLNKYLLLANGHSPLITGLVNTRFQAESDTLDLA